MNFLKLLVIFLSCISTALVFENFMSFNFERKAKGSYKLYFLLCILINVFVNLIGNTYLNYAWSIIYILFISMFLYKGENNTFFPIFLLLIIIAVEETLVCYFLEWFFIKNEIPFDNFYYIAVFISNIVLFAFYKPMKIFLSKKKISINKDFIFEEILLFMSFLVIVCLSFFMKMDLPFHLFAILVYICIVILLFDIYMIFIVERINTNNKLQEEVKIMKLNQQISEKYYQSKLDQYNQQAKIFHDIKHHLSVLEKLYESHDNEKAKRYSSELIKNMSYKSVSINNKVIRILINDLIEKCEYKNIRFEYELDSRIEFENIVDLDLVTIYSNLFNNAFEAAQKCSDPYISLKMKIHNAMVITILSNNYIGEINKNKDKILSSKKDHIGLGLENIHEAIDRNNGFYDINYDESNFTFRLILPLSMEKNNE